MGVLLALVAALAVEGGCPSEVQVREQLARLGGEQAGTRVRIWHEGAQLDLELQGAAGAATVRKLPADGSCAELAALAAAVIGTWQAELAPRPPPPSPRAPLGWDLGAGFVASFAPADFAPGAEVTLALRPRSSRFGVRIGVLAEGARDLELGSGRASFGRAALELGALARLSAGRFRFDLHADAALALFFVQGVGFAREHQAFDVDAGLGAGIRAGVRAGPVIPFLGVAIYGWLRDLTVRAQDGDAGPVSASVPRFELLLSTGLAFGR